MTSPEIYLAFGAVMLVVALLGVAIDWFGKPIRRKFIPKIYRAPEERRRRGQAGGRPTQWSDAAFVLPVMPETAEAIRRRQLEAEDRARAARVALLDPEPVPVAALPVGEIAPRPVRRRRSNRRSSHLPLRGRGWRPGDYIYNLTAKGQEPSKAAVRMRYWRNVAEAEGARIFGEASVERMMEGKPPQRRNPRTSRIETMMLPVATFREARGRTPRPRWPDDSVDPFAPASAAAEPVVATGEAPSP